MNLTFKLLEVLNAVVLSGSISRATRITGLSQPTISQQLAKFEEEIGAQLLYRRRSGSVDLTPVGEFWSRHAQDLLRRRDEAISQYRASFGDDQMVLRFGTTPSLRGRFLEEAARIAVSTGRFSRFDFVWAQNSDEVMRMMEAHQINCGIISASSAEAHQHSYLIMPLYRDRVVWAVPADIPEETVATLLRQGACAARKYPALMRWVEVDNGVPWHKKTSEWYRINIPEAKPFFGAMTHQSSVDFVAAGLATCHCPGSLLPNLPDSTRSRIRFYDLTDFARDAVLVMPRHLQSLRPYHDFAEELATYVRTTYADVWLSCHVTPLPGTSEAASNQTTHAIEPPDPVA
jgi:DNA-binding transcriptional LysR family regulator